MARKRDRFFALLGALFFLVTASALSIAVIVSMVMSNNKNDSNSTSQTATKQLAGTKLAGFTPVASVPKLLSTDTSVGAGKAVKTGDTVTVDYTGAVASTGVIFQSSQDTGQPASLKIAEGAVIEGWVKGIPGMKVGGTRRLVIPADEAYGANPPAGSGIPANAPLVFDITLHSIGQ